jgi:hypothetical protein
LPHYFLEFDLFDRDTDQFLSSQRRRHLLSSTPVVSVPVLDQGRLSRFEGLISRSTCSSTEIMEGLYIKWEEDGCVRGRYKYVRDSFTQAVEQEDVHGSTARLNQMCCAMALISLWTWDNPGAPYEDADSDLPMLDLFDDRAPLALQVPGDALPEDLGDFVGRHAP